MWLCIIDIFSFSIIKVEDVGRINLKIAWKSGADSLETADMDMDTPIGRQAYNLLSPPTTQPPITRSPTAHHPSPTIPRHPPPTFGGREHSYKALEALPPRC